MKRISSRKSKIRSIHCQSQIRELKSDEESKKNLLIVKLSKWRFGNNHFCLWKAYNFYCSIQNYGNRLNQWRESWKIRWIKSLYEQFSTFLFFICFFFLVLFDCSENGFRIVSPSPITTVNVLTNVIACPLFANLMELKILFFSLCFS